MNDVQLKCPACGAPIIFDVPSGNMKCNYCNSTFPVEEVNRFNGVSAANAELNSAYRSQKNTDLPAGAPSAAAGTQTQDAPNPPDSATTQAAWTEPLPVYLDETTGQPMAHFHCASCGGEIIGSPDLVSTKCPWCANTFIATGQLARTRVPDRLIPFKLTKQQAFDTFKKQTDRLKLLPKAFKNVQVDDIQGMYVPYWLYDATVFGQATFNCEKIRSWSDSNYHYTEHNIYAVSRHANVAYLDVPVSATSKVDKTLTEAIEPFDYSASVDFSPAYLSGFLTNKYDVEAQQANPRALERMRDSTMSFLRSSVTGYDSVVMSSCSIRPDFGELEYVFLPLWLLNVNFGRKNYHYAMNGQTGKFVGTFPVSKVKYWIGFFTVAIPMALIAGATLAWNVMPSLLNQ